MARSGQPALTRCRRFFRGSSHLTSSFVLSVKRTLQGEGWPKLGQPKKFFQHELERAGCVAGSSSFCHSRPSWWHLYRLDPRRPPRRAMEAGGGGVPMPVGSVGWLARHAGEASSLATPARSSRLYTRTAGQALRGTVSKRTLLSRSAVSSRERELCAAASSIRRCAPLAFSTSSKCAARHPERSPERDCCRCAPPVHRKATHQELGDLRKPRPERWIVIHSS